MIPADCTIIDDDVACPEKYCVPLLSHQIISSISLYEHEDGGMARRLTFFTSKRFLLPFSMSTALNLEDVAGVSTGSTSTTMSATVNESVDGDSQRRRHEKLWRRFERTLSQTGAFPSAFHEQVDHLGYLFLCRLSSLSSASMVWHLCIGRCCVAGRRLQCCLDSGQ